MLFKCVSLCWLSSLCRASKKLRMDCEGDVGKDSLVLIKQGDEAVSVSV